ncbi:hypothetical protein K2173_007274 [Erythroxylum novogranatense]|uniref:J domain-containing protein n=1 Tax=Erythroxylum novogranatense TaxID=1862640 RepID=A0AAV8T6Z3_9ROSI|nr:hypothetical protein K2173_007274 [Erythroxylum novogranatense]
MEFQNASSFLSSKKLSNGRVGFNGKQVFDAATFNGAPKFGSRVEDYREIFGGSSASSIPVLDVPELNGRVVNRKGSRVDYSKIFGGFGVPEFAMPYEELFAKPKKARAPDEARFQPAEQEHSNRSGEKKVRSSETSFYSKDDIKHLNVSYNKTNPDGMNGTNGTTHVAKLHAVPGYTRLVDDSTPLHTYEGGKPIRSVLELKQGKPHLKAVSGPQPGTNAEKTSTIHAKLQKNSTRNRSFSHDFSSDAFEIDLGIRQSRTTPDPLPSGLSSNLVNNRGGFSGSTRSKFGISRNDAPETAGNRSPPFLDEEIDANSAAAASAAALRKAIEEAQAKIKIAKELMERRRFNNGLKVEKLSSSISKSNNRAVKVTEESKKSEETDAQKIYHKEDTSADFRRQNALKTSQVTSELMDERKSSISKRVISEAEDVLPNSTQMHHRVEQSEAVKGPEEFSELATEVELDQAENINFKTPKANELEGSKKMIAEENIQKPKGPNETEMALKEDSKQGKVEKELNPFEKTFGWNIFANIIKSIKASHLQDGNEEKVKVADEGKVVDDILEVSFEETKCEGSLKKVEEPEENRTCEILDLEESKDGEKSRESRNWVEIEVKQGETFHQGEPHGEIDTVPMRIDDFNGEKENEKGHNEEMNDPKVGEGTEKKVVENDVERLIQGKEYYEEGMVGEINGDSQLEEAKENESRKDSSLGNENEVRGEKFCEEEETERIKLEIDHSKEDEMNFRATQQAFGYPGNNFEAADENNQDENDDLGRTHETDGHEQNSEELEVTAGLLTMEENEKENGRSEKEPLEVDQEDEMEEKECNKCIGQAHVFTSLHGINEHVDTAEAVLVSKSGELLGHIELNPEQKQNEDHVIAYMEICSLRKMPCALDENYADSDGSDIGSNSEESENFIPTQSEGCLGNNMVPEMVCGTEKCAQESPFELEETHDDVKKSEIACNNEKNDGSFDTSLDERQVSTRIGVETTQKPCMFELKATTIEISRENHHQMLTREEKKAEDKQDLVMENKAPKRKEAKDRNLEKEKERIAVERAIREARERAFAEARERAERAAAEKKVATEAQKTVASEVPEWSEKASTQSNHKSAAEKASMEAKLRSEKASTQSSHKSAAEKASMEAKLRAERAAVERATAEARVRALEKAISEKARNKSDISSTDKFPSASRDDGTKSKDQHNKAQAQGPSSSSRYPGGVANNEFAQGCKATLEKHQRTAERAAKALAEKNMRDLLAQKEQAERNRVAETLDAEVKRWSSGKERNLRALLSTLQYILGPDSGWQPIPLTDIVSTAAVKKAYRKATLCVHPDKLQQRGASIQQKYTCEKVFDLLKEAWNKFSMEER